MYYKRELGFKEIIRRYLVWSIVINCFIFRALIIAAFNLRPGLTSASPVLHGITKDLLWCSTLASLLTSIPFLLCFGFCSLFAGHLANRYQPEKMITFKSNLHRYCNVSKGLYKIPQFTG